MASALKSQTSAVCPNRAMEQIEDITYKNGNPGETRTAAGKPSDLFRVDSSFVTREPIVITRNIVASDLFRGSSEVTGE